MVKSQFSSFSIKPLKKINSAMTDTMTLWFSVLTVIAVLEHLLEELQRFLKLLDGENLSGNVTVQKSLLTDLLHSYTSSNGTAYQHTTCVDMNISNIHFMPIAVLCTEGLVWEMLHFLVENLTVLSYRTRTVSCAWGFCIHMAASFCIPGFSTSSSGSKLYHFARLLLSSRDTHFLWLAAYK